MFKKGLQLHVRVNGLENIWYKLTNWVSIILANELRRDKFQFKMLSMLINLIFVAANYWSLSCNAHSSNSALVADSPCQPFTGETSTFLVRWRFHIVVESSHSILDFKPLMMKFRHETFGCACSCKKMQLFSERIWLKAAYRTASQVNSKLNCLCILCWFRAGLRLQPQAMPPLIRFIFAKDTVRRNIVEDWKVWTHAMWVPSMMKGMHAATEQIIECLEFWWQGTCKALMDDSKAGVSLVLEMLRKYKDFTGVQKNGLGVLRNLAGGQWHLLWNRSSLLWTLSWQNCIWK